MSDTKQVSLIQRIAKIWKLLQKKKNIPAVHNQMDTIKAVQTDEFWQEISLNQLEKVRIDLRDLVKFIDTEQKKNVYTYFEDELSEDLVKVV